MQVLQGKKGLFFLFDEKAHKTNKVRRFNIQNGKLVQFSKLNKNLSHWKEGTQSLLSHVID